ncbi:cupin domain-containing protein [Bradyrhizobium roseum]|uniref:hypothetical protein n=1 Tax=Bradyrhizobium roseum TaxID=3056648 RepID=UPI00260CAA25|nr:hypothetical protein [Bradyrhizobium roseus]WKA26664.1 hypothetical protein QUH67_24175 [Bradyrhizobium roseus]
MSRLSEGFSLRRWLRARRKSAGDATHSSERIAGDRRQLLQALSAIAGSGALSAMAHPAEARDSSELPPPKRALTGRDEAGKSVFKSFDVTSKVVEIDSNPGLTFYELYRTEGVPALTGLEPDPMATGTKGFPGPGGHDLPADLLSAQTSRRLQAAAGRYLRERYQGAVGQAPRHGRSF